MKGLQGEVLSKLQLNVRSILPEDSVHASIPTYERNKEQTSSLKQLKTVPSPIVLNKPLQCLQLELKTERKPNVFGDVKGLAGLGVNRDPPQTLALGTGQSVEKSSLVRTGGAV